MAGVSIEHKQVEIYVAGLEKNVETVLPEARKVVGRGAFNIKKDAQRRAPTGPHLPYYSKSISYDTGETKTTAWAEIGPDHSRRQGPLGNLLEYGSPTSPPHPHLGPAGDEEEPKYYQAMEDLAAKHADPQ